MDRISDRDVQRIIQGWGIANPEKFKEAILLTLAKDLYDARQTIERLTRAAEAKETDIDEDLRRFVGDPARGVDIGPAAAPNAADAE